MKKICLICITALSGLSLVACSNSASQKTDKKSSSSSITATKAVKHHKTHKENKQSNSTSSVNSQNSSETSNNQTIQQVKPQTNITKSQSEINRERGYDPNGNTLLPGQDHAAGSNPDGSPDAWVQGQIDWEKQNGYLNPDGTETQKGIQADQEVEANADPSVNW